jgi:hypothetical protein
MKKLAILAFIVGFIIPGVPDSTWAATVDMPIEAAFNMEFPPTNIWARYSSPDGRIQIVRDEDKAPLQETVGDTKAPQKATAANIFVGNVFNCQTDAYLMDYDMMLAPQVKGRVFFMVYEADKFGTYRPVYSNQVLALTGTNYVNSGSMELKLQGGKKYMIGAGWTNTTTCWYAYQGNPDAVQFGFSMTGFTQNAAVPSNTFTAFTSVDNCFVQRISSSRQGILRMDSSVTNSFSTNSITASIDLAGYPTAFLDFRHRENGDEPSSRDGVFVSTNGADWERIVDFDETDTAWHFVHTNLITAANAVGITPTTATLIRIQQSDDYPWETTLHDGREFDDIRIYTLPNLDLDTLTSPGYSSPIKTIHLKGTDTAHEIPLSSTVIWTGATNDLDTVGVTYYYNDNGNVLSTNFDWDCGFSAMSRETGTLTQAYSFPAGTKLSNYIVIASAVIDPDHEITEMSESDNSNAVLLAVNNYSGNLRFDDVTTDITITNTSVRTAFSPTEHSISGHGTIQGYSFTFHDLPVDKDLSTLDYEIDPAATDKVYVAVTDEQYTGGIFYNFPDGVELSVSGAYANITAQLPAGMGVTTFAGSSIVDGTLDFPGSHLYSTLHPRSQTLSGTYYVCEESKPVFIEVSQITWNPLISTFDFTPVNTVSVRADERATLMSIDPATVKKSNEGYYHTARSPTYLSIDYSLDRQAEMTLRTAFIGGSSVSHFPYGVTNEWTSGKLNIVDDHYNISQSYLTNSADFKVYYSPNCPDELCGTSDNDQAIHVIPEDWVINFTAQGGMQCPILLTGAELEWGTFESNRFAYVTDTFSDGTYFMPGHFIAGTDAVFPNDPEREPGVLLYSGVMTNDLTQYERHGTADEAIGDADYAGINFRVETDGAKDATSILGRTAEATFPLSGRSKYYARNSGISGIHEAQAGKFPSDEMSIYGYPFRFENYGLAFLSSDNTESRTQGSTALPFPSDFTLEFEEMIFTCLGDLDSAQVPEGTGELHLDYWNAEFEPYAITFAPADACDCSDTDRYLLLGIRTYCANLDPQLYGVVGFLSDGNFIAPSFGHEQTDSRLTIPSSFELDGPQNETYTFYPVSGAYFNNYDAETNASAYGFINVAGSLDVPFFENLQVLLQTSASTNSANAPVYLMGGWPTYGWTNSSGQSFFDPITFDEDNDGFPEGDITLADYRSGADTHYLPRATRSWLSVVNFDYPLDFDTSSRSFQSHAPVQNDLMVLEVEHQVDYLSADNAEISFGIQYDGLPSINLVSMVFEAVDDATGATSAIFAGALDPLWEPILGGIDSLDTMLSTMPEDAFGNVVDGLVDPVVDALYTNLAQSYAIDPSSYYSNNIDQIISGISAPDSMNMKARFGFLVEGNATVDLNLTDQLLDYLDQIETMIGLFNTNATIDGETVTGLLNVQTPGEYPMLESLATNLLLSLASEYIDIFGSELQPQIQSLLAEVDPALQSISGTLSELRPVITNLQYRLDASAGLDFYQELSASVDTSVINEVCTNAAAEIKAFFDSLPAANASFDEYSEEEIKDMIKQHITDEFYASAIPVDIAQILRQRVYDLDASIRRACDSVMSTVNNTLRDLLSDYLAELDDSINGCLGDISDYVGAGQIDGYAHINGDSLTELRLDGAFQWKVPDELEFKGYLIVRQIDSDAPASCGGGSEEANEVILGTEGFGIDWISEIKADIETKFTFKSDPFVPAGMAGSFEMVEGTIGFETFVITEFCAGAGFGLYENYISAAAAAEFGSFEVAGGAFFGRTCTIDPIEMWDPEVADVLGEPPFTGIYVYGEGWMPIVDYTCIFRIKAGAGAGIFMFAEGPTIGGKIMLGASGEALCVVGIEGEVKMAGAKSGDDLTMKGSGRISGRAGSCPFCVKYSKTIEFTYKNGDFSADY